MFELKSWISFWPCRISDFSFLKQFCQILLVLNYIKEWYRNKFISGLHVQGPYEAATRKSGQNGKN